MAARSSSLSEAMPQGIVEAGVYLEISVERVPRGGIGADSRHAATVAAHVFSARTAVWHGWLAQPWRKARDVSHGWTSQPCHIRYCGARHTLNTYVAAATVPRLQGEKHP